MKMRKKTIMITWKSISIMERVTTTTIWVVRVVGMKAVEEEVSFSTLSLLPRSLLLRVIAEFYD